MFQVKTIITITASSKCQMLDEMTANHT